MRFMRVEIPEFEQGPIRPPSEAGSLLLRCTRNCPWGKCEFCHSYRGGRFSLRSVSEIEADIAVMRRAFPDPDAAFLQDADSLIMKTDDLVAVLMSLKKAFPSIARITSYARSHTIARKSAAEMSELKGAGLTRIHIGMESGCDDVLRLVKKGVTGGDHVKAGLLVKGAGIELSEYVMPGLGGRALSERHAVDTAACLNRINPDFIRIRTLALPPATPLFERWRSGGFDRMNDDGVAAELRLFIDTLDGITSTVASDHILNLLEGVEGVLPAGKADMLAAIDAYLLLPDHDRLLFRLGRRAGYLRAVDDLSGAGVRASLEEAMSRLGVTCGEDLDRVVDGIMMRYI
jgi:hypothetical protein